MDIYGKVLPVVVRKEIIDSRPEIVSYSLLDLKVGFYVPNGTPSKFIQDNLLTHDEFCEYGLDLITLKQKAKENAKRQGVLRDFLMTFSYATYDEGYFGAGVMACPEVLEGIKKRLGSNYYLLPSSIHEVIVIREDSKFATNAESFLEIVRGINGSPDIINQADVLSDSVYYYGNDGLVLLAK